MCAVPSAVLRLVWLFVCLLMAGCGSEPLPPMRIGHDIWSGNEMLAVAEHTGRFDPTRVRRVEFSSNQEVLRGLRNGQLESAALILDETLLALADGIDLVIIAAVDSSIGSDSVVGRAPLRSIADLKGRRVGVQLNSGSLQILRRALATANLTTDDVTVVNVPPERHLGWFVGAQFEAVVTYDPMRTQLLAQGGIDLFNSSAIAGDVINVLVVRRDYLQAHPDHGRALIDAWFAGREEFLRSATVRAWSAHRQGLTPEDFETVFKTIELFDRNGSRQLLNGASAPLPATARRFHGFMRENGRLDHDVAVDQLFALPAGSIR
jgi:NitT/TauT family transport system substrate-binding protein